MKKRKLLNLPSTSKYVINEISKRILKLNIKVIKPLVDKASFKMFNSKYATYIDPDILDAINYVFTLTKANHRIDDQTMLFYKVQNSHLTHRKIHEETVACIAGEISSRLGLNINLAKLIGDFHDIGQPFDGHEGEYNISTILQDLGIGCAVHNALGVEILVDKENVIKKVKEKVIEIKKNKNHNISDEEIRKLNEETEKAIIYVLDGILAHNGEGTDRKIMPNYNKSISDFWRDYQLCFIKKGYDRTIRPMTLEGAVMKFSDIIAYVGSDFLDGCRYGCIDINNLPNEYINAFKRFGIEKEFIDSLLTDEKIPRDEVKNKIVDEIRKVLINDLVENSFGKSIICFSSQMVEAMYNLRNVNYEKIVKAYHEEESDTLTYQQVKALSKIFTEEILKKDWLSGFPKEYEVKEGDIIPKDSEDLKNRKSKSDNDFFRYLEESIYKMTPTEMARQMYLLDEALTESISEEIRLAKCLLDEKFGDENDYEILKSIQNSKKLKLKWVRICYFANEISNNEDLSVSKVMEKIRTITESKDGLTPYKELLASALASKYVRGSSNTYVRKMIHSFEIKADELSEEEKLANLNAMRLTQAKEFEEADLNGEKN